MIIRAPKELVTSKEDRILGTISRLSTQLKTTLTRDMRHGLRSYEAEQSLNPVAWVNCLDNIAQVRHEETERWSRADIKKLTALRRHCQHFLLTTPTVEVAEGETVYAPEIV